MKNMNMEDAIMADKMILELAFYSISKGHQLDYKIKSQEEYMEMMRSVDKRFAEYKRLLISKETSWEQLSNDILTKYAVDLRKFYAPRASHQHHEEEPRIMGFKQPNTRKPNVNDN